MDQVTDKSQGQCRTMWAFGGGKSGVGRSFLATNLGILLAHEGYDVILFDGNLGAANLHTCLGIPSCKKSLSDFTLGAVNSLEEVLSPTPIKNLRIISGINDALNSANPHYAVRIKLAKRLSTLQCDFLLLDLGAGSSLTQIALFMLADTGMLLTTPEPQSVELIFRFLKSLVYRRLKNMVEKPRFENIIDEEMLAGSSGNILRAVNTVLDRIGEVDAGAASSIGSKIFDMDLRLLVNMTRDQMDQSISEGICDVIKKFYGFDIENLGYFPYDERIVSVSKRNKTFIEEYKTSDTAAYLGILKKSLVDSFHKNPVMGQLNLVKT